jgi:hypothetical protein
VMDSGEEEVDWTEIAAAVELEEAEAEAAAAEEAEAAAVEEAAAVVAEAVGSATKRKRPPAFSLADVDSDPGTRKQIEEYATQEIRDEMRRAYLSKGVGIYMVMIFLVLVLGKIGGTSKKHGIKIMTG